MGLSRALAQLKGDRAAESAARDVLAVMTADPHPTITVDVLRRRVPLQDATAIRSVLDALVGGRVLDYDGDTACYRYHEDRALDFEVRRFIRTAGAHDQHMRTNADRFRQRYGRA